MSQEHVSIQVARNLLKAGKLGVGPGAKYVGGAAASQAQDHSFRESDQMEAAPVGSMRGNIGGSTPGPPPKYDKKAAAQAMADKLRRIQEEEEEKEDLLAHKARKAQIAKKKMIGIGRLGPVSAREEEVDPLKIKIAALEARREEAIREKNEQQPDDDADAYDDPRNAPIPMIQPQEELRRLNKEQRKKKQQRDEDSEEAEEHGPRWNKRQRSESPEEQQHRGGAASSGSGSNLMSEAEVQARLKRGKKGQVPQRGSASAAARIQREMAEWEQSKAKNPEFWKPPKFCLVLGSGRR